MHRFESSQEQVFACYYKSEQNRYTSHVVQHDLETSGLSDPITPAWAEAAWQAKIEKSHVHSVKGKVCEMDDNLKQLVMFKLWIMVSIHIPKNVRHATHNYNLGRATCTHLSRVYSNIALLSAI